TILAGICIALKHSGAYFGRQAFVFASTCHWPLLRLVPRVVRMYASIRGWLRLTIHPAVEPANLRANVARSSSGGYAYCRAIQSRTAFLVRPVAAASSATLKTSLSVFISETTISAIAS